MDLTTIEKVRQRVGVTIDDPVTTGLLASLISRASAHAEKVMNRLAEAKSRTTQFDVQAGQREFWLPAFPITAISSVYADSLRGFGTETLIDSGDYYYEAETGLLSFETALSFGRGVLKVTYTAGMAATAAAFVTAYPDIADAVTEHVAWFWQRRTTLGQSSISEGAGSISMEVRDMLPTVKDTLLQYRRLAHV